MLAFGVAYINSDRIHFGLMMAKFFWANLNFEIRWVVIHVMCFWIQRKREKYGSWFLFISGLWNGGEHQMWPSLIMVVSRLSTWRERNGKIPNLQNASDKQFLDIYFHFPCKKVLSGLRIYLIDQNLSVKLCTVIIFMEIEM